MMPSRVLSEEYGALHGPSLLVEWGSITKTVTAFVTHELDRTADLAIDTPVSYILPSSRLDPSITLRHLVEHTSGLSRLPKGIDDYRDPYRKFTTEFFDENVIPGLPELIEFKPGAQEQYSNLGYALLGRTLEVATNWPWWDIANKFCFDLLKVEGVVICPQTNQYAQAVNRLGSMRDVWNMESSPFLATGGLWSSLSTLEEYARAVHLKSGRGRLPGWRLSKNMWWHNGHTRDAGSFIGVDTSGQLAVSVSTLNYPTGSADRLASDLIKNYANKIKK